MRFISDLKKNQNRHTVCPEKNEPLNILHQQVKNCHELNIVKRTQTCKYLGYCSQIVYNSMVRFNMFSVFTKRCYKFHFRTLLSNVLTHA